MALGRHPMVDPSRQLMQPRTHVPRSAFSVRDFHKTTIGMGQLTPVFLQEVLPGDSFKVHLSALIRLAAPIVPVMDNLYAQTFFFFVPNRLVFPHWEPFMAGPQDSSDVTTYLVPQVTNVANGDCAPGTLCDYFGLTVNGSGNTLAVNALPFRGYTMIWNEWFRDQVLQAKIAVPTGDGPDSISSYGMLFVNKRHDYFTSAKPWPQAASNNAESGSFGALVPGGRMTLGDRTYGVGAPVWGLGVAGNAPSSTANIHETGTRDVTYGKYWKTSTEDLYVQAQASGNYPNIRVLVNDLRTSFAMQEVLERQARGGGRYTEFLRVVFGVHPQDSRLQRPEFLGGGKTIITVNPVAQTSATYTAAGTDFAKTVTGQQAANGYIAATDHGFSHSFPEHGFVFGLLAIRSDLTYQQGVDRMWKRRSAYDYYRPETANLGEQSIMSSEIFCDGSGSQSAQTGDWSVFGYQERWAEYRTRLSRTSGLMRSIAAGTLDVFHFGEKFAGRPTLNGTAFLPDLAPVTRVLQATAPYSAAFMADVMFETTMVRPLPMFSVPGMGGRL